MTNNKIMVFIPIYNCEKQIIRVINQFNLENQKLFKEIVVVDNRSQDDSLIIAKKQLEKQIKFCKVTILQNDQNYNLGGSIKVAFKYAVKNKYDYMITIHGDDQADISDVISVIQSKKYKSYDMCIGARFHAKSILKGYSLFRIFGNRVLNFCYSFITGKKIDDLIAGLNIYNINFIKELLPYCINFPNNLTFDAHCLLYLIKKKKKFLYFPLTWRESDQISNARIFKQTIIILKLLLKFKFYKTKLFIFNKDYKKIYTKYSSKVYYRK